MIINNNKQTLFRSLFYFKRCPFGAIWQRRYKAQLGTLVELWLATP